MNDSMMSIFNRKFAVISFFVVILWVVAGCNPLGRGGYDDGSTPVAQPTSAAITDGIYVTGIVQAPAAQVYDPREGIDGTGNGEGVAPAVSLKPQSIRPRLSAAAVEGVAMKNITGAKVFLTKFPDIHTFSDSSGYYRLGPIRKEAEEILAHQYPGVVIPCVEVSVEYEDESGVIQGNSFPVLGPTVLEKALEISKQFDPTEISSGTTAGIAPKILANCGDEEKEKSIWDDWSDVDLMTQIITAPGLAIGEVGSALKQGVSAVGEGIIESGKDLGKVGEAIYDVGKGVYNLPADIKDAVDKAIDIGLKAVFAADGVKVKFDLMLSDLLKSSDENKMIEDAGEAAESECKETTSGQVIIRPKDRVIYGRILDGLGAPVANLELDIQGEKFSTGTEGEFLSPPQIFTSRVHINIPSGKYKQVLPPVDVIFAKGKSPLYDFIVYEFNDNPVPKVILTPETYFAPKGKIVKIDASVIYKDKNNLKYEWAKVEFPGRYTFTESPLSATFSAEEDGIASITFTARDLNSGGAAGKRTIFIMVGNPKKLDIKDEKPLLSIPGLGIVPVPGSENFSPNQPLTLTFNKTIVRGSFDPVFGDIMILKYDDDSVHDSIRVNNGNKFLVTGAIATIVPNPLNSNTKYYVLMPGNALLDEMTKEKFGGIITKNAWTFTTGDVRVPMPSNFRVEDGPNGRLKSDLEFEFNIYVDRGTGTIEIHRANGAVHEVVDVAGERVKISGSEVSVQMTKEWAFGEKYSVWMNSSGVFVGLNGFSYPGTTNSGPPAGTVELPKMIAPLVTGIKSDWTYKSEQIVTLYLNSLSVGSVQFKTDPSSEKWIDATWVRADPVYKYPTYHATVKASGKHQFTARQFDPKSNISSTSASIPFTIDPNALDAPKVSGINREVFDAQKIVIEGLNGAKLEYSLNGGSTWQKYGSELAVTIEGKYEFVARQTLNNKVSVYSQLIPFEIVQGAPVTKEKVPANGATDVNLYDDLKIVFSTPVTRGESRIEIREYQNDQIFSSITVLENPYAAQRVELGKTNSAEVSIKHRNFMPDTKYYVKILPDAFSGSDGKDFPGISHKDVWSFTTAAHSEDVLTQEINALAIKYAPGDSAAAVTQNITLPKNGSRGSAVTWSIPSKGEWLPLDDSGNVSKVTRNYEVKLQAVMKSGTREVKRVFTVNVIYVVAPKVIGIAAGIYNTDQVMKVIGTDGTVPQFMKTGDSPDNYKIAIRYKLDYYYDSNFVTYTTPVTLDKEGDYRILVQETYTQKELFKGVVTIDKTPPEAPQFQGGLIADNRYYFLGSKWEVVINRQSLSDVVEYSLDDGSSWLPYDREAAFVLMDEGSYTISARSTDKAGNISATVKTYLTIDRTPPPPPLISGISSGTFNTDQTVTLSPQEQGGALFWLCSPYNLKRAQYNEPVTFSKDGSYKFEAFQFDLASNRSAMASVSFTIDKTPPTAPTLSAYGVAGNLAAGTYPGLTFVVTGSGESETTLRYSTDNGSTWKAYTTPVSLVNSGIYQVIAQATDAAGNTANSQTVSVAVTQGSAPTVSGITAGTFNSNQTFTLSGEPGSTIEYSTDNGVIWQNYTAAVTLSTDGFYQIVSRQTYPAGNVSPTSTAISVVIDTSSPAASTIAGISAGLFNVDKTFTVSGAEPGGTLQYSIDNGTTWQVYSSPVTLSSDGRYQVMARQIDSAGNISPRPLNGITVIIDKTPPPAPTVSGISAGTFTAVQTFTVNGSGGLLQFSYNNGVTWQNYTAPVTLSIIGFYQVLSRQTDTAGNVSPPSGMIALTISTGNPPTISGITAGTFNSNQTFTLSGESGSTIEFSTDNGATWHNYLGAATLSTEGSYQVVSRQTYPAGNVSPTSTAISVVIDTRSPYASTIAGISAGNFNVDKTFTVSGAEPGGTLQYSIDNGTTWQVYSSPVTLSSDGLYQVMARQIDSAGNISPRPLNGIAVIIDKTPPPAPTVSGISAGTFTTVQTFTVNGSDGLLQFSYNNGVTWQNYTGPVALSPGGVYDVVVRQTDAAGNVSSPSLLIYLVVSYASLPTSSVSPGVDAIEVDPAKPITVIYPDLLDQTTVTSQNVNVLGNGLPLTTICSYSPPEKKITITPGSPLPGGATITVELTTRIKQDDGVTPIATYSFTFNTVDSSELTAWWKFENNTTDSSGNGHTLTAVGTPSLTAAKAKIGGYSCLFNGASRYQIDGGGNLNLGNKFTITAWIYIPAPLTSSMKTIFANGTAGSEANAGFKFAVNTWNQLDKRLMIEAGTGGAPNGGKIRTATNLILEDNWYHVGMTIDKTTGLWNLYYNGANVPYTFTSDEGFTEANFNAVVKPGVGTNQASYIGDFTTGGYGFKGYIDDFRIYNKVLTDSQILKISQEN